MKFERWYRNDYYLLPEKELMTLVLFHFGSRYEQLLLDYEGAIMHHNLRLINDKDVEWNLQRVIRCELKMNSVLKELLNFAR